MEKVYHVLYADEIRLNSIDAQLNGKVPLSLAVLRRYYDSVADIKIEA